MPGKMLETSISSEIICQNFEKKDGLSLRFTILGCLMWVANVQNVKSGSIVLKE